MPEHIVVAVSRWRGAQSDKCGGSGKSSTGLGKGPTPSRARLLSMTLPAIPQGLPPFFLAIAQDDGAAFLVDRFCAALIAAGSRPELHRYLSGGHGFGMSPRGTTSDHSIDAFFWWLEANGLTRKPGDPERPSRAPSPTRPGRSGDDQ
jgi:acetyl esterase/lipase